MFMKNRSGMLSLEAVQGESLRPADVLPAGSYSGPFVRDWQGNSEESNAHLK